LIVHPAFEVGSEISLAHTDAAKPLLYVDVHTEGWVTANYFPYRVQHCLNGGLLSFWPTAPFPVFEPEENHFWERGVFFPIGCSEKKLENPRKEVLVAVQVS